jgi:ADP-heptose:LPS heptosyltransferase
MRSNAALRRLDHAIGAPLIRLAAAFRRRRPLPPEARRIAILQPTAIGDTVIASGIPAAIRRRYPDARIDLLHGATNAAAVGMIDADLTTHLLDFRRPDLILRALRALRPEIVVDLTPWPRLTALCAMASGAVTVGYDSEGQGRGRAFDLPVRHRGDRHELGNVQALAAVFDPDGTYAAALKTPTPCPLLDLPYGRLILFHTTSGGSGRLDKAWLAERWIELARRICRDGYVIGFTGAPSELGEIEPLQRKAGAAVETLLLAGRLNLVQFAYAVSKSRALISVDTGSVHIACGLDAPVVGLYGPTLANRWGPWSVNGIGVDSPHPRAGYCSFGFETSEHSRAIMEAITVDAVYDAFRRVARPRAADYIK